jgi:hypothetical protein
MQFIIDTTGNSRCIYDETIPLAQFGRIKIRRGSHVEPVSGGRWIADMKPVDGPVLGPFSIRSEALTAERRWLEQYWLNQTSQ